MSSKDSFILKIYKSKNTVFSIKDIALIWRDSSPKNVNKRLYRYIKSSKLYKIQKGFYAKDENYNRFELATKIYTPSYVSFETVLGNAGVTFQYYGQIFVASYLTREKTIEKQVFSYKKIKDTVLTNSTGIENKKGYSVASPERAFLDVLYLNKNYHFDSPLSLNKNRVMEILPIYENKRMGKAVKDIFN